MVRRAPTGLSGEKVLWRVTQPKVSKFQETCYALVATPLGLQDTLDRLVAREKLGIERLLSKLV